MLGHFNSRCVGDMAELCIVISRERWMVEIREWSQSKEILC